MDATTRKHTQTIQTRHAPSYKQLLEVKTNPTSFLCGNPNGHHNTELRIIVYYKLGQMSKYQRVTSETCLRVIQTEKLFKFFALLQNVLLSLQ